MKDGHIESGFRRAGRIATLGLSEIVQLSETAARLKAEGRDVVALSTGEPDFPTPEHVIEAAAQAMRNGQTRYPPTAGTAALRAAIAERAGASPEEVIVSTGAKQVLANLFLASLDPGNEVIAPTPCWSSYRDIVTLADGVLREVPCRMEDGFRLTPEALERAITPRTRWLLINSPGNPTGAMYPRADLEALAEVLRRHPQVWVASDEIYEHIRYAPFTGFREAAPDLAERTVVVNGVSKAYAMTGWRIGWAVAPRESVAAMLAVQGQVTSGASSVSQAAALAALTDDQGLLAERRETFRRRRDAVVRRLAAVPGLSCPEPEGAFYVFPSCRGAIGARRPDGGRVESDADLCAWLLESGVAVVPGSAFGAPGHFRLSYAYAEGELVEGCARIARAVEALEEVQDR